MAKISFLRDIRGDVVKRGDDALRAKWPAHEPADVARRSMAFSGHRIALGPGCANTSRAVWRPIGEIGLRN